MTTLDRSQRIYSAQYGNALADHLPMTLAALKHMGASELRRAVYARDYVEHKHLRPLAASDTELAARTAMRSRIEADGRASVLAAELATLGRGIGAGAFHALIRVAYGIVEEDDDEIAAGLVYWRDVFLDLGATSLPREAKRFDVRMALDSVRTSLADVARRIGDRGHISAQMEHVADDTAFDLACGHPSFDESSLGEIAAAMVRAFAATQSFRLLHAMTATHALRIVLPLARDSDQLMQDFWRAVVAVYVSAGAPPLPAERMWQQEFDAVPAWSLLNAQACESEDEHVIKATYTAWSENNVYHDRVYGLAVQRYLASSR